MNRDSMSIEQCCCNTVTSEHQRLFTKNINPPPRDFPTASKTLSARNAEKPSSCTAPSGTVGFRCVSTNAKTAVAWKSLSLETSSRSSSILLGKEFTLPRNMPGSDGREPLRRRRTRQPPRFPRCLLVQRTTAAKNAVPLTRISNISVERVSNDGKMSGGVEDPMCSNSSLV